MVSFTWNVTEVPVNQAPVVTNPGVQNGVEDDVVSLQVVATDPEDDGLTYSATNLPTGLSIDTATGLIGGTIATGASANSPYSVEVTVTDDGTPAESTMVSFTWNVTDASVNEAPVAAITANPINGLAPLPVLFSAENATDDKGIVRYEWDFNDGTTSTVRTNGSAFSHTFAQAGIYIVVLTVTDEEGLMDMATITITVSDSNAAPNAVATATPLQGSAPLEVTFNGSASTDDIGIVSYSWDFGDGTSSTEANPIHVYDVAGEYTVVLTVSDGEFTDTATLSITVLENGTIEMDDFELIVAPNPVENGEANVVIMSQPVDDIIISVFLHDESGRLINSYNAQTIFEAGNYKVPTFGLRSGLYYITLLTENGDSIGLKILVGN